MTKSESSEISINNELKLPEWFLRQTNFRQKESVNHMVSENKFKSEGERGARMLEMMIKHIKSQE